MQTQKENDVLLLTVPIAIMLQNQPRTRLTQKHAKKTKFLKRVKHCSLEVFFFNAISISKSNVCRARGQNFRRYPNNSEDCRGQKRYRSNAFGEFQLNQTDGSDITRFI